MAYLSGGCAGGCLGAYDSSEDIGSIIEGIGNTAVKVIGAVRTPSMPKMPTYGGASLPVYSPLPTYTPPAPIYTASVGPSSTSFAPTMSDWLPWIIGAGLAAGYLMKKR